MKGGLAAVQHGGETRLPRIREGVHVTGDGRQSVDVALLQHGQAVQHLLPGQRPGGGGGGVHVRRGVAGGEVPGQSVHGLAGVGVHRLHAVKVRGAEQLQLPALIGAQGLGHVLRGIAPVEDILVIQLVCGLGGIGLDPRQLAVDILRAHIDLPQLGHGRHGGGAVDGLGGGLQQGVHGGLLVRVVDVGRGVGPHIRQQRGLVGLQLGGHSGQRGVGLGQQGAHGAVCRLLDAADVVHDNGVVGRALVAVDGVAAVPLGVKADQLTQQGLGGGELLRGAAVGADGGAIAGDLGGVAAAGGGHIRDAPQGGVAAAAGVGDGAAEPYADDAAGNAVGGAAGRRRDGAAVIGVGQGHIAHIPAAAAGGLFAAGLAEDAAGTAAAGGGAAGANRAAVFHIGGGEGRALAGGRRAYDAAHVIPAGDGGAVHALPHLADAAAAHNAADGVAAGGRISVGEGVAVDLQVVFTVAHQAAVLFLGGAHAAHDAADLAEHGGVHQISLVVALRVGQEQAIGAAILYVAGGHVSGDAADVAHAAAGAAGVIAVFQEGGRLAVVEDAVVLSGDQAGAAALADQNAAGGLDVPHRARAGDDAEQALGTAADAGGHADAVDDVALAVEGAGVTVVDAAVGDGRPLLPVQVDVRRQHGAGGAAAAVDGVGEPGQLRGGAELIGRSGGAAAGGLGLAAAVPLVRHAAVHGHGEVLQHGGQRGLTAAQGGVQRDRVGAGLQLGLAGVQRGFQRSGLLRQLRQDVAVYPVPHGGGLAPEVVQLFQLVGIGVLQIAYRVFLFFDKLGLLCLGGHCLHLRQRRLGNGHQFVDLRLSVGGDRVDRLVLQLAIRGKAGAVQGYLGLVVNAVQRGPAGVAVLGLIVRLEAVVQRVQRSGLGGIEITFRLGIGRLLRVGHHGGGLQLPGENGPAAGDVAVGGVYGAIVTVEVFDHLLGGHIVGFADLSFVKILVTDIVIGAKLITIDQHTLQLIRRRVAEQVAIVISAECLSFQPSGCIVRFSRGRGIAAYSGNIIIAAADETAHGAVTIVVFYVRVVVAIADLNGVVAVSSNTADAHAACIASNGDGSPVGALLKGDVSVHHAYNAAHAVAV